MLEFWLLYNEELEVLRNPQEPTQPIEHPIVKHTVNVNPSKLGLEIFFRACIRCGYCYSCHWKKEKLEKSRLQPLVIFKKYPQHAIIEQSHRQQLITE
jgi:hypothetical protein